MQFGLSGSDGAPHSGTARRVKRLIERIWAKPASIDLFDDEPWSAVTRPRLRSAIRRYATRRYATRRYATRRYATREYAAGPYAAAGTRWNTWGTHRP